MMNWWLIGVVIRWWGLWVVCSSVERPPLPTAERERRGREASVRPIVVSGKLTLKGSANNRLALYQCDEEDRVERRRSFRFPLARSHYGGKQTDEITLRIPAWRTCNRTCGFPAPLRTNSHRALAFKMMLGSGKWVLNGYFSHLAHFS